MRILCDLGMRVGVGKYFSKHKKNSPKNKKIKKVFSVLGIVYTILIDCLLL